MWQGLPNRKLLKLSVTAIFWAGFSFIAFGQQTDRDWGKELQAGMELKDLNKKQVYLEQLRASYLKKSGPDRSFDGQISHALATSLGLEGRFAEAFGLFEEALAAHKRPNSDDPSMVVNSYYNLAYFHLGLGLVSEFRTYADSCIYYSKEFPKKRHIGIHAYEQLATYFYDIGDYTSCLKNAELGIQTAKVEDRYVGLLYLQSAQAILALPDPGNTYLKAATSLEESRKLLTGEIALEGLVKSVEAYYQLKTGYPKLAKEKYEEAIQIYLRENDYDGVVRNLLKLGNLYSEELGDIAASMRLYREGLKTLVRVNRIDMKPRILNGLATQLVNAGDFDAGIAHLHEALDGLWVKQPASPDSLDVEGSGDNYSNDLLAGVIFGNLGKSFADKFSSTGDSTDL